MLDPAVDQASGLRRLFTPAAPRWLPIVASGEGVGHSTVVAWLAVALADAGVRVLVIDGARGRVARMLGDDRPAVRRANGLLELLAGERGFDEVAVSGGEGWAVLPAGEDLAELIAGGYDVAALEEALAATSADFDLVLILAEAATLGPLFAGREARALVLATPTAEAVTAAYSAMKALAVEHGFAAFHLAINRSASPEEAERVGERLRGCAERFLKKATRLAAALPYDRGLAEGRATPGPFAAAIKQLAAHASAWAWSPAAIPARGVQPVVSH